MAQASYVLSHDGECERLERQAHLFGLERGFQMVDPLPGTRLLDAGCGSGWLSRLVAERMPDCDVVGVDANPDHVDFATQKAREAGLRNLTYEVGEIGDLPFGPGSFDRVWSLMVIMFLPDCRRALTDLARLLTPGGRLICAQQGDPVHQNAPRDPELEADLDIFRAGAFPDWEPHALPLMMKELGLVDLDVKIEADPLYTVLGAPNPEKLRNHREVITSGSYALADAFGGPDRAAAFVERLMAFVADPATTTITGFWTVSGSRKPH